MDGVSLSTSTPLPFNLTTHLFPGRGTKTHDRDLPLLTQRVQGSPTSAELHLTLRSWQGMQALGFLGVGRAAVALKNTLWSDIVTRITLCYLLDSRLAWVMGGSAREPATAQKILTLVDRLGPLVPLGPLAPWVPRIVRGMVDASRAMVTPNTP